MKNFWCTLFVLVCSLLSISAYAINDNKVSQVTFNFNNDVVQINYTVSLKKHQELRNVRVSANINGKVINMTHVSGDIGKIKDSGLKTITWDCFADLGHEPIEGDVSFDIFYDTHNLSSYGVSDWNVFGEVNYTPSVPFTFGIGIGKRFGIYARYGDFKTRSTISGGGYFRIINWLTVNAGYNYLKHEHGVTHGYEVGGTVYFFRSRWLGVNAGYIGSFTGQSEFQIGLSFCWNI